MRNRKRTQSRAHPAQGQAVDGEMVSVPASAAANRSWFELLLQALSSPPTLPAGIADDQLVLCIKQSPDTSREETDT